MRLLLVWILNAIALLAVAYLYPGVQVQDWKAAAIAALVLGLVNTLVKPILVLLTLPVTILTLGLFLLVINALLFWGVAQLIEGFHVNGFWAAVARRAAVQRDRLAAVQADPGSDVSDAHLQLRIFPAEDAGGGRQAARRAVEARRGETGFLFGHVRCRRLDQAGHLEHGDGDPCRRTSGGAAHLLHRHHARRRCANCCRDIARPAFAASWRCAAMCRPGPPAAPETSATPVSSWNSYARKPATGSTSKWPRIPNITRNRARPPTISRTSSARCGLVPVRRSRSTSTTPTRTSASSMKPRSSAARLRSSRASCRSRTTRSWRASQMPAAPKFRDGCAGASKAIGDDRESIRAFGLDVVTDLCDRLLNAGAPGLHFYTMNQADATLELWRRLGLPR